jgi:hypothetical protein
VIDARFDNHYIVFRGTVEAVAGSNRIRLSQQHRYGQSKGRGAISKLTEKTYLPDSNFETTLAARF